MSSALTASQSASTLVKLMESMGLSVGEFWLSVVWFVFLVLLLGCLYWAWQKKHISLFGVIFCATCLAIICAVPYFIIGKEIGKSGFAHWTRGMGLFAGAFLAAPVGLYLAYRRTGTLGRQTQNEEKRIISEEFSRSINLLGNEQASVRQGGIYALGRLAKDNKEMRDTIMKIICSFVRGTGEENSITTPSGTDVEAALYVIRERNRDESHGGDISNSKLMNGDLSKTNLTRFNLSNMDAAGCIFQDTNFTGAYLNGAIFRDDCDFGNAIFNQTDVSNADFEECTLTQAQVDAMLGNEETKLPQGIERPRQWANH